VGAEERRHDVDGVRTIELADGAKLSELGFDREPIAALRLTRRRAGGQHLVEPPPRGADEVGLRRGACPRDRLYDSAAGGRDCLVAGSGEPLLQLVLPIAGENEVRVWIDEAWHHRAPARVETDGLVVQLELARCLRRGTDEDDDPLMGGDRCVAKRRDLALCRAAPRRRTGARRDQARVLDHEVGGDGHPLSVALPMNARDSLDHDTRRHRGAEVRSSPGALL
jgi:hypothetical protein